MASSAGEEQSPASPASREEILDTYVTCYSAEWAGGRCGVCEDSQVRAGARGVLLREGAGSRFSLLPFYPAVTQCVEQGAPHVHSSISTFMKATELLEMMCVNLFLFPWKKEIRTLKKFTAHFIYFINPGLPNQMTRSILQSIGYCRETDTEYVLVDDASPDMAKRMGFELFLARMECEYLLEVMKQKPHAECLKIIHRRAASPTFSGGFERTAEEECPSDDDQNPKKEVLEDNEPPSSCSKSNPTPAEDEEDLQSLKPSTLETEKVQENTVPEERRSSRSFMSEDRSILEMQENYPDLAFRQKPIFRKSQKAAQPPKEKEWIRVEPSPVLMHTANTDLSGPQSIALHTESGPAHRALPIPEKRESTEPQISEEKQPLVLRVGTALQSPGLSPETSPDEGSVMKLVEKMHKLQMKEFNADEPLKYPIEETTQTQQCGGCQDFIPVSPLRSPDEQNPPVLCRPTSQTMCSIAGCGRCSESTTDLDQNDPIKEPPNSFYIPNCLSGCDAPPAPPKGHSQNCSEGISLRPHRSLTQQPEDDLLQTYVML